MTWTSAPKTPKVPNIKPNAYFNMEIHIKNVAKACTQTKRIYVFSSFHPTPSIIIGDALASWYEINVIIDYLRVYMLRKWCFVCFKVIFPDFLPLKTEKNPEFFPDFFSQKKKY